MTLASDPAAAAIEGLLRPLSARSLIASALLGSHPPALPGRLLVAMGQRFGLRGGAVRVALSRMVERGELVNEAGVYSLAGDLLERQERQDRSRHHHQVDRWDGTWEQAVITASGRSATDRNRLRQALTSLGLAELREGVWMRPANLDPDRLPSTRASVAEQACWFSAAPLAGDAATGLAASLFDLERWATTAAALDVAMGEARDRLDEHPEAVVSGFNLASATLRHLVHDPQLPPELTPPGWPADSLRRAYDDFEGAYRRLLRRFFRSVM